MIRPLCLIAGILSACACSAGDPPLSGPVERVLLEKGDRRLTLYSEGQAVRSYTVSLGANPMGHKEREGDKRTPEGIYTIDARNPNSSFHRSLQISYPNAEDRRRAEAAGENPGGLIMIHGIRNGLGWLGGLHRLVDWTDGCIAVTDSEMDEFCHLCELAPQLRSCHDESAA